MELGVKGMMLKLNPTTGRRTAATRLVVLAQAALLLFLSAGVSAQEGNRLQDIQVQSLPGQRVELKHLMPSAPRSLVIRTQARASSPLVIGPPLS